MVTPQIGSDGSVMLSLSPTLTLPTHDADGNRVGGSLGVADMLARLADGETIVVSGFGRLLEERDTGTGAAQQLPSLDGRDEEAVGGVDPADPENPPLVSGLTMDEEYDAAEVDLGSRGQRQRVLAAAHIDSAAALDDARRLNQGRSALNARAVTAGFATGTAP